MEHFQAKLGLAFLLQVVLKWFVCWKAHVRIHSCRHRRWHNNATDDLSLPDGKVPPNFQDMKKWELYILKSLKCGKAQYLAAPEHTLFSSTRGTFTKLPTIHLKGSLNTLWRLSYKSVSLIAALSCQKSTTKGKLENSHIFEIRIIFLNNQGVKSEVIMAKKFFFNELKRKKFKSSMYAQAYMLLLHWQMLTFLRTGGL